MEQRSDLNKGQGSNFTISECPTTVPDVDNNCDKHLDHLASAAAGTCEYKDCVEFKYIRRSAYMNADGFYGADGIAQQIEALSAQVSKDQVAFDQAAANYRSWSDAYDKEVDAPSKANNLVKQKQTRDIMTAAKVKLDADTKALNRLIDTQSKDPKFFAQQQQIVVDADVRKDRNRKIFIISGIAVAAGVAVAIIYHFKK